MVQTTRPLIKISHISLIMVLIIILSHSKDKFIKIIEGNYFPVLLQSCEAHKPSSEFTSKARIYSRHSPVITYSSDYEDQYYNSVVTSRKRNYPFESYEDYDLLSDNIYSTEEVIVGNKGNKERKDSRLKEKKTKTILNSYNKDKNQIKHEIYDENNSYSEQRLIRNKSHIYMNSKNDRSYSFTKNKTKQSYQHGRSVNYKYQSLKKKKTTFSISTSWLYTRSVSGLQ